MEEQSIKKTKILLSKEDIENGDFGKSRNTFVLNCTRTMTWKLAREYKFRNPKDISSLNENEQKKFKNEIYSLVKELFKKMDKKYNGIWPDTSNHGKYPKEEFDNTFNNSYTYAISTLNDFYYTDEQREQSLESRRLSKDVNLYIVNSVKSKYDKIKRKDLLEETNTILTSNGMKKISFGSLKRYLSILEHMSDDDKKDLYDYIKNTEIERKKELSDALESSEEDSRKVKICKKRLKQVNIIKEKI